MNMEQFSDMAQHEIDEYVRDRVEWLRTAKSWLNPFNNELISKDMYEFETVDTPGHTIDGDLHIVKTYPIGRRGWGEPDESDPLRGTYMQAVMDFLDEHRDKKVFIYILCFYPMHRTAPFHIRATILPKDE